MDQQDKEQDGDDTARNQDNQDADIQIFSASSDLTASGWIRHVLSHLSIQKSPPAGEASSRSAAEIQFASFSIAHLWENRYCFL